MAAPNTTESALAKLRREKALLPAGDPGHAIYDDAIKKATTHQPQVQVNYPSSSGFGINPATGKEGHYTIGKDGTLRWDAIQPIPAPGSKKEASAAADEALTVESVRQRVNRMSSLIQGNIGIVGPGGIARRIGETAAGAIPGVGGIPTPALDYENEKNLMVADVRKLIEKDPNLSNQERETLSRTLGGGVMQTPGSAVRTLNNVLSFIEGKKIRGTPKTAAPAPPKIGEIVLGHRYKGGDPAKQESWEKVQ
jgi:hypothetical protein